MGLLECRPRHWEVAWCTIAALFEHNRLTIRLHGLSGLAAKGSAVNCTLQMPCPCISALLSLVTRPLMSTSTLTATDGCNSGATNLETKENHHLHGLQAAIYGHPHHVLREDRSLVCQLGHSSCKASSARLAPGWPGRSHSCAAALAILSGRIQA